jgi:hypothetical protein
MEDVKMKKMLFWIVVITILPVFGGFDDDFWTIHIFRGYYRGTQNNPLLLSTKYTDPFHNPKYTVRFVLPDRDSLNGPIYPDRLIDANEFLEKFGNLTPDGLYKTLDYWPIMEEGISAYWENMFKDVRPDEEWVFPKKIVFKYINAPNGGDWVANKYDDDVSTLHGFEAMIKDSIAANPDKYDGHPLSWYYDIGNEKNIALYALPTTEGQVIGYGPPGKVRLMWKEASLNITTAVIGHELGHAIYNYQDQGNKGAGYGGINSNGEPLGRTYSTTLGYDMMHGLYSQSTPYQLYGLIPFHTEDLIETSRDELYYSKVLDIKNLIVNENPANNMHQVRLKAIREEYLTPIDSAQGIQQAVSLPINNDSAYPYGGEFNGDYVENQKFLIEYRTGKGFDDFSNAG